MLFGALNKPSYAQMCISDRRVIIIIIVRTNLYNFLFFLDILKPGKNAALYIVKNDESNLSFNGTGFQYHLKS